MFLSKKKYLAKRTLARYLGISRASIYYKSRLSIKDNEVLPAIRRVMRKNPSYGHRRIAIALGINKKRVLRIMRRYALTPMLKRRKPINYIGKPANSKYPNLLKNMCPIAPNVIWSSDFTYINYRGRFIYLCTVIDIFSRVVLGWNISTSHTAELVKKALIKACENTGSIPDILHTDQGVEYESREMNDLAEDLNITISRCNKASPWQNGCQEAFFSNFKLDLGNVKRFASIAELYEVIHSSINYYNKERIHLKLKMSPLKFLERYKIKQKKLV